MHDGQRCWVLNKDLDAIVEAFEDDRERRKHLARAYPSNESVYPLALVTQDRHAGFNLGSSRQQIGLDGVDRLIGSFGEYLGYLPQRDAGLSKPTDTQQACQVLDSIVAVPRDDRGHRQKPHAVVVAHRPRRCTREVSHLFDSHGTHRTL